MSSLHEVFTSLVVSLLGDLSNSFIAKIWNANDNFNSLKDTLHQKLRELQGTLERIHAQEIRVSYTQIPSDWLDDLLWCHYEIEDTIDSINNLAVSKQAVTTKFLQTHLQRISDLQNMSNDIETKLLKWKTTNPHQDQSIGRRGCEGSRHVSPIALGFVRAREKEAIIRELKSHPLGVSILGISGTGKTKLAEAVCTDARIKEQFDCILSPKQLSTEFSLQSVLECMDSCIPAKNQQVLIKLDGLESVTPEDWDQFQSRCKETLHITSKFLITTQNPRVVDVIGCHNYVLGSLSAEECFLLISHRAKAKGNLYQDDVQAIKHNENELVERCKGLPLLANHIGLLLSAEAPGRRHKFVAMITGSSMWNQSDLGRVLVGMSPISMLARKQHLQRCVAYCSLFPPDYSFKRGDLVQLWMVERFAHDATDDVGFLEQAASGCFDDLLSHSVFEMVESQCDGEPCYKMHPLMYDLARNIGSKAFCGAHVRNSLDFKCVSSYIRHLSLSCESNIHEKAIPQLLNDVKTCNGLRTFLLLNSAGEKISQNPTFFETLERLRVLDLSHTNLSKLSHVSNLKHLRYLDLSHTPIKKLPSLSKNPALLVLKLDDCDLLHCLPKDLTRLTNLISLEVNIKSLGAMPQSMGKLSKLQCLNVFIVGKDEGYKIAELKSMNDLRESLCITKLENVKTRSNAQEAMLHEKKRLERLELQWTHLMASTESASQVLEGLQPPKNLKALTIRNYGGSEFPQWLSTPQVCGMLKTIHLAHCEACRVLPSLWKLPLLKTLHLEAMYEITSLNHELLCLESLRLCDLPNLCEWTVQLTVACDKPRLRELEIVNCPRLMSLPSIDNLPSLESLEIHECAQLQELPTLSSSVQSVVITDCDFLRRRCQVGRPDWHKIRGINVVIDSKRVDTAEQHSAAPHSEAVVHQSNYTQVIGQLCTRTDAPESCAMQVCAHPSAHQRVNIVRERDILQEGPEQNHAVEGQINQIPLVKRRRGL